MTRRRNQLGLICASLMLSASGTWALPNCPDDPSAFWTNCVGTYATPDGATYVGEWLDDKRNGQGTFTWPDGATYVGQHKDDKANGQGTATYANGATYVGEWLDGTANGQGTYSSANGDIYVGEHKDGKAHGQGTATYANGATYVGGHKDDKRNGQGTYTFANGNIYVGRWLDDEFNGRGVLTPADGTVQEGIFKNGVLQSSQKASYSSNLSFLQVAFTELPQYQREKVQSILSDLGLYTASIDGLYGRGTSAALTEYNNQYLNGSDLTNSDNVRRLIDAILSL
jgi:hypothetical protein